MQFTTEQYNIFSAIKDTTDDIAILATAGAGKTTTILEGLKFINPNEKTTFLSFSKAIVQELERRVPSYVKAQTLHSLGYSYLRAANPTKKDFKVEENKYFSFAVNELKGTREGALEKKDWRMAYLVQEICAFARQTLSPFDEESLMVMCAHYNIDFEEESILLAKKLLDKHADKYTTTFIDYVDMVYLPAVNPDIVTWKYKNVFLDEAQDTNRAQLQLVENILTKKSKGRLISVGDDYQCIYGFSGADVEAFKRIRERPNTITLPLSYTFRCPKSHVVSAQEVNPEIKAPDFAKEGELRSGDWREIREGDIVLSRVTRPLVALYFSLIDSGIKATIVGKEMEKGLLNLIDAMLESGEVKTMEGLKFKMEEVRQAKITELTQDGVKFPKDHYKYITLDEKLQIIKLIAKKVTTPASLQAKVKEVFAEHKKAARLMTIHRAKGLENERVFVITKNEGEPLMPSKYAQKDWEHQQERNLIFVARTRSKSDMIFIELSDV